MTAPISEFHSNVAAKAFKKLTGSDPEAIKSWAELRASLRDFGQSESPVFDAIARKGARWTFLSSSEAYAVVIMLFVADRGKLASKVADEIDFWQSGQRVMDETTRRVLGTLMAG